MKKIYLDIIDLRTGKIFRKYFETEFERDKYKRKSKYFKHLVILNNIDKEY